MPTDAEVGRIRYLYERLYTWMETVFTDNEYEDWDVEGWDFDITRTKHLPIITIGVEPISYNAETYNRDVDGSGTGYGSFVYFPFTLYIYDYKTTKSGYSDYYDVYVLSDRIIKYLRTRKKNQIEMDTHGIIDILDLTTEESAPRNVRRLARMIMTGTLKSRRLDSL
jgi:hypothetical protein